MERFSSECPARSLAWHDDGRQFICGNADGSLVIWNAKKPGECVHKLMPHGQKCRPITQVFYFYFLFKIARFFCELGEISLR